MKRSLWIVALAVLLLGYGCRKEESPNPTPPYAGPDTAQHALIMYLVGSNSLSWSLDGNASQARQAVADGALGENDRLVVFHDTYSGAQLYEFVRQGDGIASQVVLKDYGAICSTDTSQIEAIMRDIVKLVPARSYGIVFGAHGSGWLPTELKDMKQRSVVQPSYLQLWNKPEDSQTRNFGPDNSTWIDIPDLARSIASIHFDFILFDACFMGGVEVLYEMRHAAHYLIASPAEILGSGFPYDRIIPLIFSERLQLEGVCRQFMAYYRAQSGYNRSGSITLIRADQLDGLAAAARDVWSAGNLADVNAGEVQPFERMHTHKFFDLADYYSRLVPVPQYTDFDEQLSRTVLFSDYTDRIYSAVEYGSYGFFDVRTCCGLSTYIPQPGLPSHNEAYRSTAWARATGAGGQ